MKIESIKIPVTIEKKNWRLVRDNDGLTKESVDVIWVEWGEDSRFKEKYDEIAVGRSLIMSPFSEAFTWMTTQVTEIVVLQEDYIKFNTENSTYSLSKLN